MNPHTLTRAELAAYFAAEFSAGPREKAFARAVASMLPPQRADELAAVKVLNERIRGSAAFVLCMLVGAGASLFLSDHYLASMALAAASVMQFVRAKAVFKLRVVSLSSPGSDDGPSLDEERARFRAEFLPVVRLSHPELFERKDEAAIGLTAIKL